MKMTTSELAGGATRVAFDGRLDVAGVDAVEARFAEAAAGAPGGIVVDMREVSFVASLGLRMFVAVARKLIGDGRAMVLYGCQPAVAEVFEMAALDDLFRVVPTEESALATIG